MGHTHPGLCSKLIVAILPPPIPPRPPPVATSTPVGLTLILIGPLYILLLSSTVGPQTTIDIAQEEDLPIGLVQEMLDEVEMDGEICRDDGGVGVALFAAAPAASASSVGSGEVRYWVNVFRGYVWDGQEWD